MRFPRPPSRSRAAGTRRRGPLLPTALAFGVLWVYSLALAAVAIESLLLLILGAAGLLFSIGLLFVLREHQTRLRRLATTDALTGLVNHRGFHEALGVELEHARRQQSPLALVHIDLDNFKAVNDTHGHPYGDEVLRAVGKKLRSAVRATDIAARVGGEEFALILPQTSGELAYGIAERARAAVASVSVRGFKLSCSAGVAAYPTDAEDTSSLCQLADAALYWAKRRGKHRTRRFDPGNVPLTWTEQQAAEISAMLAEPQPIKPVFQPVVAMATGHLVGYEALARFSKSPGRSPAAWFAQAHGCGLGPELEATAIRAALEPLGRPLGAHLALNVSPSALSSGPVQEALPDDLTGIVIEITEHEFVPDDDTLAVVLGDLRERGARIAIDDAGAGYAGLKQVMRVRPDIVKVDRELTEGIHSDPARMALVESFVRFARGIGATVCAEGVESLDDVAVLGDLDVEWGQGYAFAPPAEPWARVSRVATEVCRAALEQALRADPAAESKITAGDRGLENLSARLASARSHSDLRSALALIATELNAEKVCLSQWHPAEGIVETVAADGQGSGQRRFPVAQYPLTHHVLGDQRAVQVLVGDPASDPKEVELLLALGYRSLLMMPVVSHGKSLGIVEAYSAVERPWTRTEINRARIISNQFGSVIGALSRSPRPGAPAPAGLG